MKQTINIFRRSLAIIITAILMFVLAGCSTEASRKTEHYVTSVKNLVNESVNNTRTLKEQKEKFDCSDNSFSKSYISTLDTLSGLYEQLIQLESADGYQVYDNNVKLRAKQALTDITKIKNLAQYAFENGDDSLYKKDIDNIYKDYQEAYNSLITSSSQIQTEYRNA